MHTSIFDSPILELRVLNGPQAGAALPLTGNDIVLGSGRDCDVILQSPCIAPRHACLSVTEDAFTASTLDGEISVAGNASDAAPWPFGTTIYLDDIGVTIERNDRPWSIPAPRAERREHQQANALGALLSQSKRNWKRFTLLFIFLAIAAAGSQVALSKHGAGNDAGALSPSNVNTINKIVARYRADGRPETALKLEKTPKGLRVHGYLPNASRVNALRRELSEWRPALEFDVKADDALLAASRHFLGRQQSSLRVAVNSGHAVLSGFEERREDVQRLAQDLKKNVPGLAGVDAMFVEQPRLEAWLRTWQKSAAFSMHGGEPMHIDADANGILTLSGNISSLQIAQLKQTLTQRSLRQNMLLAMRIDAKASGHASEFPPTVRSFSVGAVPYVFLNNGRRLMIGGNFDGFQLVAIKGQGPIFEKKGG